MHEVSIELERMEFGLFHVLPGSSLGRRASLNFELSDPLTIRGRRRLCLVSLHGSKSLPLPQAPWTSRYASSQRKLEFCAGATGSRSEPRSRWHETAVAAAQEPIHSLNLWFGLRLLDA